MRVAVVQLNATSDKKKNINNALSLTKKAGEKKARFVLLPEVFNFRGKIKDLKALAEVSENIPGPSTYPFFDLAKKYKMHILIGSIYERTSSTKAYNTSILISSQGKILAKYRKNHLFKAVLKGSFIDESKYFLAGKYGAMPKIEEFKIGLSICYDLRFPKLYQQYAKKGAQVLCIPSAFTYETGKAHWEVLCRARAIENQCYVFAPNQFGTDNRGVRNYGCSLIIDPWGNVLAKGAVNKQEILFADIRRNEIIKANKKLPTFKKEI